MKVHRFNNAPVRQRDTRALVLAAIKPGECIGSELIAYRVGVSRATATMNMRSLIDSGEILVIKHKGFPRYSLGKKLQRSERKASISYAGPVRIGRGLANW